MKQKFLILMFLVAGLLFSSNVHAQGWNGIIPLESTRNDVKKILGDCKEDDSQDCLYKLEKQNVFIIYKTLEPCAGGIINAPKGAVLSISIFPQNRIRLGDLNINLKNFVEEEDHEIVGARYFINHDEGMTIGIQGDVISGIDYVPSKKNVEKYKCKQ